MQFYEKAHRAELITVAVAYDRIAEYARQRLVGMGGRWHQTEYKKDFFHIFHDAYYSGVCGYQANRRYETAYRRRKRKKPCVKEYIVNNELLADHIRSQPWWKQADRRDREKLVSDLAVWWEEWTFAWSQYPNPMPRMYRRRRPL